MHFRNRIEEIFFRSFAAFMEEPDDKGGGSSDSDEKTEKEEKEGKFEITWKTGKDGKKFFTGPDGTKYYDPNSLSEVVSKRLEEDRTKRKADADKEALREKEDYRKLHETSEAELQTLKPKAALADKLIESNNRAIDERIKEWPSEITAMDPGKDNVEARLDWVEKAAKAVKKMETGGGHVDGEHGKKGTDKNKIDGLISNRINDQTRFAIPGQKK